MKATGIVRRIDDLGRIVIPKEIRRTMRIREGDPLEIYTSPDGEVIFKKYSPVGEISCTASQYADVLSKVGGCPAVICDRDHVIAVSGMAKKEVIERRVSGSLEDLIEQRKSHVYRSREDQRLNPIEGIDRYAIAAAPILSQGDVNGAVIMLSGDDNEFATNEQSALVQACRNVLRQADGGIKIREGQRPPAFISFSESRLRRIPSLRCIRARDIPLSHRNQNLRPPNGISACRSPCTVLSPCSRRRHTPRRLFPSRWGFASQF